MIGGSSEIAKAARTKVVSERMINEIEITKKLTSSIRPLNFYFTFVVAVEKIATYRCRADRPRPKGP